MKINDPEVRVLAGLSQAMMGESLGDEARWEGSPFAWIRSRPSRAKGAIAERLVAGWLATKNFNVVRSPDSDADRIVEGKRAEIKFSTLWENDGYTFQQFRDQDYDVAICLGVSPFHASCWAIPKKEILRQWRGGAGGLRAQHGGAGGSDTAWLTFPAAAPPHWLAGYGGTLLEGAESLARLAGNRPF